MTLRPVLLALPLLAACAGIEPGGGGGSTGMTLSVDGAPVALFAVSDIDGDVHAIQGATEYPTLGTPGGGGTYLYLPASTSRGAWDYGFTLRVDWEAWPPLEGDPGPAILASPARDSLELRLPAGAESYRVYEASGPDFQIAFERLSRSAEGIAVRATFAGTACRDDAPGDCVAVEGTVDLVAADRRRAPGSPPPPAILL